VSTASTIADYIRHKRSLGIRFDHGATVLSTFSRSVGKMPLRDIRPETITRFINREGISAETMAKQHGVLARFFRYAVTRRRLKASPMPSFESRRCTPSFTPYIYSEAELKRLLAAVPAATGHTRCGIHADTLRTFVLLLYGAGLRRGEARRLKVEDVDLCSTSRRRSSLRRASSRSARA
jgi:integrase/recombinase XerD